MYLFFNFITFRYDDEGPDLTKQSVTPIKWDKWTKKKIENIRICSGHFFSGS